jgi:hypothetical protein
MKGARRRGDWVAHDDGAMKSEERTTALEGARWRSE